MLFDYLTKSMIPNEAPFYPKMFSWIDSAVQPGIGYKYKIEVTYPDGSAEIWNRVLTASLLLPKVFALRMQGPHPIRLGDGAEFVYDIPLQSGAAVSIALYNIAGRRVATIADGYIGPGSHVGTLAGPDIQHAGPGVCFLRMQAGDFTATKKLVLVK